MASRRQTRQHSLRKQFVREPSVLAHHSAVLIYGISPREILHMNQDGLTEQNLVSVESCGARFSVVIYLSGYRLTRGTSLF